MSLRTTTSQTAGPYLEIGLNWLYQDKIDAGSPRYAVQGRVLDGDGNPVNDALIEIWQADAGGIYAHPDDARSESVTKGFRGFGRVPTDDNGSFRFATIKPGGVPGPSGTLQAPHLSVIIFMRGLLRHLHTRIYFPDEAANAKDPVLSLVAAERRPTLVARKLAGQEGVLEWNVHLQGANETVFFDV